MGCLVMGYFVCESGLGITSQVESADWTFLINKNKVHFNPVIKCQQQLFNVATGDNVTLQQCIV